MLIIEQPILQDFQIFLDYFSTEKGIELTKTKRVLRNADLSKLNEKLHYETPCVNSRNQQTVFSTINTFFYIARVSELTQIKKAKSKFFLLSNASKVKQFKQSLNKAEQYFFLLESFWCYVDWEAAYDIRGGFDKEFYTKLSKKKIGKWITIGEFELKREGKIYSPDETSIAEIFAAFGLLELIWDESLEKRPSSYVFPYKLAAITELGKNIIPVLFKERPRYAWKNFDPYHTFSLEEEEEEIASNKGNDSLEAVFYRPYKEAFIKAFLKVLPEEAISNNWYPLTRSFIEGQYTFKVALTPKLYRTIILDANSTLEELHCAIQEVYQFEDDHLYVFYTDESRNYRRSYVDSRGYEGDGILADSVQLGELGFYEGKQFIYLFDFGAHWEFTIDVLSIDTQRKPTKGFKLLESVGNAPPQYPDYGEEEW
ncbi:MAG: plasmid pRiA4b ORF-3 family protein [Bacteroidota bacterium]